MTVLALDTASPRPAVALLLDGRLYEEPLPEDRRASEDLLPAIRRVLGAAGATLDRCERIAVCAGPGSFTGLRVGLATAWGFARGLGIAVEAVSTLEAMAEAARSRNGGRVVAVLDAGRGDLVCERFALDAPRARSLAPPTLVPREALPAFASGDRIVALAAQVDAPPPGRGLAAALAEAVAAHPRPLGSAAAASAAIYARPSAAEEKHGPA